MKTLLFLLSFFVMSLAQADNSSVAQVQATVIPTNTPILMQKLTSNDKTVEITATINNSDFCKHYSIVVKEKDTSTQLTTFHACSHIIRAKIINNKLLISVTDNNGRYTSYWSDI